MRKVTYDVRETKRIKGDHRFGIFRCPSIYGNYPLTSGMALEDAMAEAQRLQEQEDNREKKSGV